MTASKPAPAVGAMGGHSHQAWAALLRECTRLLATTKKPTPGAAQARERIRRMSRAASMAKLALRR